MTPFAPVGQLKMKIRIESLTGHRVIAAPTRDDVKTIFGTVAVAHSFDKRCPGAK